ncbi:hypothetical protein [Rhodococcus sp. MEB032]|nr:hypothetical protein [Rhodococcus sp. MEB032]
MKRIALYLTAGALFVAFVTRSLGSLVSAQPFGVPYGHRRIY